MTDTTEFIISAAVAVSTLVVAILALAIAIGGLIGYRTLRKAIIKQSKDYIDTQMQALKSNLESKEQGASFNL